MPVTYASAHNGGRSEVNMNYIPNSNEYAFINVLRYTDNAWTMVGGGLLPPDKKNSDGYPTDLTGTGGGVTKLVNVPTILEKTTEGVANPRDWVLSWTGTGQAFSVVASGGGAISTVSGSGTSSPWRFTIPTDGGTNSDYKTITITLSTLGTGLSNLQLYHYNHSSEVSDGQMFTSHFKNKLLEGNFGVIRFLNWQNCNTTTETTWATRKTLSQLTWGEYDYKPEFYAGTTSNTAATYAVSVPGTLKHADGTTWNNGDAPKDKDTIIVKFGSSISSGSMTLQVGTGGSSSAISVIHNSHSVLSGTTYPEAGKYAILVYDSSLNVWIKRAGDLDQGDCAIDNGVPIEALFQLCAEIGAHPWFHIPPYSLDPVTDWLPSMAKYVADNKPSWMIPRFEVFNEFWHPGTYGRYWGNAKAAANGWSSPSFHQWYGKAIVNAGQVLNTVLGAGNYHLCCAVQTGTGNTTGSASTSDERMSAQAYFSQAAAAQSNLTGSWGTISFSKAHAYSYATHVTVANYFNPINLAPDGTVPPLRTTLTSAVGGIRFPIVSCSGGTMVVTASAIETPGGTITSGMTLEGLGVPSGTTVTNVTGTTTLTLTLNNSFTLPAGWHVYAYLTSGSSSLQDYVDSANIYTTFNATVSGDILTVHSTTGSSSGVGSIQIGQIVNWTDGWLNSYITGDNSTDGALTGTGGVGTYRLDDTPHPLSNPPTAGTCESFWIFNYRYLHYLLQVWKTWAQGFGVQKMNFYEGGYSPDYTNTTIPPFCDTLTCMKYLGKYVTSTSRYANGIYDINLNNYALCTSQTGGGFVSEFPSQYLLTGPYPSLQVWTTGLETIYKSPNPPIFESIKFYNAQVAASNKFVNLRLRLHA